MLRVVVTRQPIWWAHYHSCDDSVFWNF